MNILKRGLAPLTPEAWEEIDERASQVLKSRLTARKAVKVDGPKGLGCTAVSEGRIYVNEKEKKDLRVGVFRIKPLMEVSVGFSLNRWELDNISRGAKDVDLSSLEEAAKKIADFEESVVYSGYEANGIKGFDQSSAHEMISFGTDGPSIVDAITKGIIALKESFQHGPYVLIAGKEAYTRLNQEIQGYPLTRRIAHLLDGKILFSPVATGAYLIPYNDENLELTIGRDFSIGYEAMDGDDIKLFIMESLTFRVLNEEVIVNYKL